MKDRMQRSSAYTRDGDVILTHRGLKLVRARRRANRVARRARARNRA